MKKFFLNIFATTGISMILLAIVALLFQAECIYIQTVFQVFGANILVQSGLFFINKIEVKYAIVEMFLSMILITAILLVFGSIFHWFTSTPLWTLIIMGLVIYVVSAILNLFFMKQEAQEINTLLKKKLKKEDRVCHDIHLYCMFYFSAYRIFCIAYR